MSQSLENKKKELQSYGNYQPCGRCLEEGFPKQIIMECRTTPAVYFRTMLGFKQYDPITTQEPSMLSKVTTLFSAEKILL